MPSRPGESIITSASFSFACACSRIQFDRTRAISDLASAAISGSRSMRPPSERMRVREILSEAKPTLLTVASATSRRSPSPTASGSSAANAAAPARFASKFDFTDFRMSAPSAVSFSIMARCCCSMAAMSGLLGSAPAAVIACCISIMMSKNPTSALRTSALYARACESVRCSCERSAASKDSRFSAETRPKYSSRMARAGRSVNPAPPPSIIGANRTMPAKSRWRSRASRTRCMPPRRDSATSSVAEARN